LHEHRTRSVFHLPTSLIGEWDDDMRSSGIERASRAFEESSVKLTRGKSSHQQNLSLESVEEAVTEIAHLICPSGSHAGILSSLKTKKHFAPVFQK
jgi:hypothetical protein